MIRMMARVRAVLMLAAMVHAANVLAQTGTPIDQPDTDPGTTGSLFGSAIGVSSKRIYIGAPHFDANSKFDAGRVFMFDAKTRASLGPVSITAGAGAYVGSSIAAYKTTTLIGAPGLKVDSTFNAGGALLYTEKTDSITTISNPEPTNGDNFGAAVAAGSKFLVIGAPGDFGAPAVQGGGAFAVARTTLIPQRLVPPAGYAAGDKVGTAVAISSRFIAVGAPEKSAASMLFAGGVHIYDAKTLAYVRTLNDPFLIPGGSGGRFGNSLAFGGIYLFVGAVAENFAFGSPDYRAGAGAVYQYDTRSWSLVRRFYSTDPQAFQDFGWSIAADTKRLYVGVLGYDHSSTNDGRVEVFASKLGNEIDSIYSPAPARLGDLGFSVAAMKGNLYLAGAPGEIGNSGQGTGRVYLRLLPRL